MTIFRIILQIFCLKMLEAIGNEQILFDDLLQDYNSMTRPLEGNGSEPVKVHLKFSLLRLIELDSKNQVTRIYAWLEYLWNDANLRWDPQNYENITDISMPIGKIWRPELFLYNAVDSQFDLGYPTNIFLNYTGDARWVTPSIFKSTCIMDITWFPFDEQYCFLEFAPWTYSADQMQLQSNAQNDFNVAQYVNNGEWELNEHYAVPYTSYDCCPKVPFSGLTFFMHFKRRTLYYIFNMIFPSLIITMISLLSFLLPPESGDKTAIQIAVLLSICFFFSILSSMLPATSDAVPLLGLFFFSCMLIVSASLCCTVYVLNLHYRSHPMGPFAQALLLHWLPWALRINRPDRLQLKWENLAALSGDPHKIKAKKSMNSELQFEKMKVDSEQIEEHMDSTSGHRHSSAYNFLVNDLQEIQQNIQQINSQIEVPQMANSEVSQNEDWKFAGKVVDRLCLWLFSALIVACIATLLIRAPHLIV